MRFFVVQVKQKNKSQVWKHIHLQKPSMFLKFIFFFLEGT